MRLPILDADDRTPRLTVDQEYKLVVSQDAARVHRLRGLHQVPPLCGFLAGNRARLSGRIVHGCNCRIDRGYFHRQFLKINSNACTDAYRRDGEEYENFVGTGCARARQARFRTFMSVPFSDSIFFCSSMMA